MGKGNVPKAAGVAVKPNFFPVCTDKHKAKKDAVQVDVKRIGSHARAKELKKEGACRILDGSTNKMRVVKFGDPSKRSDSLAGVRNARKGIKKRGVDGGKKTDSKSKKPTVKEASVLGQIFSWIKSHRRAGIVALLFAVVVGSIAVALRIMKNQGPKGPKGPSGGGGKGGWRSLKTSPGDGPPTFVDGPPTLVDPTMPMVAATKKIASMMAQPKTMTRFAPAASGKAATQPLSWQQLALGLSATAAVGISYYLLKTKAPATSKVVQKLLCPLKP
jgi:hypothetical protein